MWTLRSPAREVLRLKRSLESGQLQRADSDHASVRLLLEDGTEYAEAGTLQFTDVSVDESTGAVTLRAIFPNPRQDLLPGMYVRAILNEGVDEAAILLPQRALVRDARGNATAYVVNADDKIEIRPLKVGRTHGTSWVVLDGWPPETESWWRVCRRSGPALPFAWWISPQKHSPLPPNPNKHR